MKSLSLRSVGCCSQLTPSRLKHRLVGLLVVSTCSLMMPSGLVHTAESEKRHSSDANVLVDSSETPGPNEIAEVVSFNDHIRPIFTRHCTSCHGGVKQAADVSFVYAESVASLIEPGNTEESPLFQRVTEPDEESRMPPPDHGPRLSKQEIELLRRWIQQGAHFQEHWSYRLPVRPALPHVEQSAWVRQPLDAFVLKQLESRGVQPSPDELPLRWLRRVSLDLVGLPPTAEQRQQFEAELEDNVGIAYENAVDRLLASPHFGERWAAVWFDQVRYADSRGLGIDGRRTVWKYRDFVIDAFNRDMPYDEFTKKQIAGDLLPQPNLEDYIATTVHRLTQSNEEGGTDDEEFRVAAVLDRVNTVWQTWLGTSFGCTQCHDHPYDPITHEEYYRFVAYFNNTADSDLDDDWPLIRVPNDSSQYEAAGKLEQEKQTLQYRIWKRESEQAFERTLWRNAADVQATSAQVPMAVEVVDDREEFLTNGTVPAGLQIQVEFPIDESLSRLTGLRLVVRPHNPDKAIRDSEWGFVLSHLDVKLLSHARSEPQALKFAKVIGDEPYPRFDPTSSLKEKSREGFAAFSRIHYPRTAVFILEEPISIEPGSRLRVAMQQSMSSGGSHPLVIKRGDFAVSDHAKLTSLIDDESLIELRNELRDNLTQLKQIKSTTVPVMLEREEKFMRPTHVFERGLFLTKGAQVKPGVPNSLNTDAKPVDDRLALAKWLIAPGNPLVARVAVNRLWSRLFGTGLVATEEDFGVSGDIPSHPELLDDLAVRFREDYQWSTKKLLREIALSSTYRQSASRRPEIQRQDPKNRWLASGPRQPLSAEMVRDQALAVSGLLDTKMFGPPVRPPIAKGVWLPFQGGDKWEPTTRGDPERYRRSIYTYVKRSIPYPMFATYDAPSRELCVSRRLRSNTPLQPLVTLNNETFVECAERIAEELLAQEAPLEQRLANGFESILARPPSSNEVETLTKLYKRVADRDDPSTAMTAVTTALLNLDEALNH